MAEPASEPATVTSPPAVEKPRKESVHKTDYEKDVVYLYQFIRTPVIPSPSPFCLKVETWLKMADIKYENVDHKMKYKSKKGQLPFIELNGAEINDSEMIIKELSKHFSKDLDQDLTPEQKNVSHAFISMLNNHTCWVCRWWRYNHPGEFIKMAQVDLKKTLNSKLPKGLLNFFFKIGFRSNIKQAINHGVGRNSEEEIYALGKTDLKALSEQLADKQYFFGDEPHLLDCVAFAHVAQFVYIPFGDFKDYLENECPNLLSHLERMKNRYWPDWEEVCAPPVEVNANPKKNKEPENKEAPKEAEDKKDEEEAKMEEKEPEDKTEGGDTETIAVNEDNKDSDKTQETKSEKEEQKKE